MQRELPARPDLEHYRKTAKEFVRGFRAGDPQAVRRAEAVLGSRTHALRAQRRAVRHRRRARLRLLAEFKRACERTGLEALQGVERGEVVLGYHLRYTEGEPVRVFVKKRLHRFAITDGGNAIRLAGKPPGWREAAGEAVEEFWLNLSRKGVVCVGTVYPLMLEELSSRTAEASLAVYAAVRDLDE